MRRVVYLSAALIPALLVGGMALAGSEGASVAAAQTTRAEELSDVLAWRDSSGLKDLSGGPYPGEAATLLAAPGNYVYWYFKTGP